MAKMQAMLEQQHAKLAQPDAVLAEKDSAHELPITVRVAWGGPAKPSPTISACCQKFIDMCAASDGKWRPAELAVPDSLSVRPYLIVK